MFMEYQRKHGVSDLRGNKTNPKFYYNNQIWSCWIKEMDPGCNIVVDLGNAVAEDLGWTISKKQWSSEAMVKRGSSLKPGIGKHTFNASTWQADVSGLWIQSQPGLQSAFQYRQNYRETLSQKN